MALCVLTGDIVGSTALSSAHQEKVIQLVASAHDDLAKGGPSTYDSHRGDGWQMAFMNAPYGLRHALYIRALLKSKNEQFETRIAISYDKSVDNIGNTRSAPYVASGHALDDMPDGALMGHAGGGALQAATLLADYISRDWTSAQARAVRPFLYPFSKTTQQDVASDLGISRQAVGQALDAAGYPAIKAALATIEGQAK